MTCETISIDIKGYWRDINSPGLPNYSGVFFVYTANYNSQIDQLSLQELIYIGKASNIRRRVNSHPKKSEWGEFTKHGSELCFSIARIQEKDCLRVKEAYVMKHQPLINPSRHLLSMAQPIKIVASGVTHLLQPIFTVKNKMPLDFFAN